MKLDVVVVPDFQGPAHLEFEHKTNLLLASWLEHKSELSTSQLHVACIGDPPDSTARLAECARSRLTVHEPIAGPDRFRNKLQAFRTSRAHSHFLLLDADIVLLRPIQEIASRLRPDSLGVGYANIAHLSLSQWGALYAQLGMPPPTERAAMAEAWLGDMLPGRGHGGEIAATFPYFNSGVVSAPWSFGLGALWERLIDEVPRILLQGVGEGKLPHHALYTQPPLAVAVEALRRQGKPTHVLPDALHARWQHFCRGTVAFDDALVVHNTGIFKPMTGDVRTGIAAYVERSRNRMKGRGPTASQQGNLKAYANQLGDYLLLLQEKWIDGGGR